MANEATTVDGVEPSVLVKYVQNVSLSDPSEGINLAPFDDGSPRSIAIGGEAVLVTPAEFTKISSIVPIEVAEDADSDASPAEIQTATEQRVQQSTLTPVSPTPPSTPAA